VCIYFYSFSGNYLEFPYDGGAVGNYIGDAGRNLVGNTGIRSFSAENSRRVIFGASGAFGIAERNYDEIVIQQGDHRNIPQTLCLDASLVWPVADEFRPASISAIFCVSY
jgi:hypothetical protein